MSFLWFTQTSEEEIACVSSAVVELSSCIFTLCSERKKPYIRDDFLRSLCYKNRRARQLWIKQGHPRCGPIYEV